MCYLYSAIIKRGAHLFCAFNDNMGGGVDGFSLRFIIFLLHGFLCFSVMSVFTYCLLFDTPSLSNGLLAPH